MSKIFALLSKNAGARSVGRICPKIKNRRKIRFNFKFLNIAVLILICVVGVFYLAEINGMATDGFKMKKLEQRQAELTESIQRAELQVAELQSMQKLEERVAKLNMVGVARAEYLATAGVVAVK